MPRGSQIAITSPTDFKVFRKEDSHLYRSELQSAAFVFTILRDGSIEGTRCPKNTTSYSVRILEEVEEEMPMEEDEAGEKEEERLGQGSGSAGDGGRSKVVGYETRFFGDDGFWIVFFVPV